MCRFFATALLLFIAFLVAVEVVVCLFAPCTLIQIVTPLCGPISSFFDDIPGVGGTTPVPLLTTFLSLLVRRTSPGVGTTPVPFYLVGDVPFEY